MNKVQRITKAQQRRNIRDNAMPEVKKLVRKYDRAAIQACLNMLRDYELKVKQLSKLKDEATKLERELH